MSELVSIIIPYHNGQDYIEECLASVYNQSYKNIEAIAVNDGSPHTFLEELQKDKYPSLKLHLQQNQGPSVARNRGVELASGKYILFLDCDDTIEPAFVEKTLNVLKNQPEVRLCYTKGNYFEDKTGEWYLPEFDLNNFLLCNCIPITTLFYKEDFVKSGGFDERLTFFEDWDLWMSIIEKGNKVARIDEFLFNYRIRNQKNSLTNTWANNHFVVADYKFIIYQKHYALYEKNGLDFNSLTNIVIERNKYRRKYYNVWYKKLIYKFFKKKKYQEIYGSL